jgi:beta-lactamase superfamily II metal-dependent hydrolase
MFEIETFPAQNGDAFWVRWGSAGKIHHLLIDCGYKNTYEAVKAELEKPGHAKTKFEVIVYTHIDSDHVEGAVHLMGDAIMKGRTKDVWFNSWDEIKEEALDQLGAKQGEYLEALLKLTGVKRNQLWGGSTICVPDAGPLLSTTIKGLQITLLSPSKAKLEALQKFWVSDLDDLMNAGNDDEALELLREDPKYAPDVLGDNEIDVDALVAEDFEEDNRAPNGSSIAFLAEYDGRCVLFAADAHPSVLETALRRHGATEAKPLALELLKLSHHGSKNNTSPELLKLLAPKRVLISTNGARHYHPHAQAIARVVRAYPGVELVFNYRSDYSKAWLEPLNQLEHGYTALEGKKGRYTFQLS